MPPSRRRRRPPAAGPPATRSPDRHACLLQAAPPIRLCPSRSYVPLRSRHLQVSRPCLSSPSPGGRRDHRPMRVRRTFAFLDLSGFTALTESEGDERAVAVLGGFRAALRDICSRRAVRIAKWLGDGGMLVSVDTMPLVAATLEMKDT